MKGDSRLRTLIVQQRGKLLN